MAKKIILTESQFKDYMRSVKKQLNENNSPERDLNVDEIEALLHKMIMDIRHRVAAELHSVTGL